MTIIEQIKAEIERQIKDPQEHCYGVSSINKLRELLDFIGTIEVEKPISHEEELEEEIQSFWNRASGFQPKFTTLEVKENGFATIARHFAQWQKKQMIKEAVEGEITKDNRGNNVVRAGVFNRDFEYGDKVRVIVCKKEN